MGTAFTLDLFASDEARAGELFSAAFEEIDRLEELLSNYRPSSELSRLSQEAARGPTVTDPETFRFLERSLYWSRASDGAFDITVGPLLKAWGFFQHSGAVPSSAALAAARQHVGWGKIRLDAAKRTVEFSDHRPMSLDPGSIGKGFAVDSVIRLLRREGVRRAFLSAGNSTLYGLGAPPEMPGWPVQIPDPRDPSHPHSSTVYLRDTSLSTGACTEKYFVQNGHRYCHIFDPLSGRPVEDALQSTVIDPSATDSDALSTVVFVLPAPQTEKLLTRLPGTQSLVFRLGRSEPSCSALHWQTNVCAARRSLSPSRSSQRP